MNQRTAEIPEPPSVRKSPTFYSLAIGLWLLLVCYLDPKILSFLRPYEPFVPKASVLAFTLLINIFSFYGIYDVLITVFALSILRSPPPQLPDLVECPPVAVLYLTMNDFCETAALSCLRQDYPAFRLFILDDSTEPESLARVDEFAAEHAERIQVIRRTNKKGFKAGNLNHGLKVIGHDYPYFCVSDADGVLPVHFLKRLMRYFLLSSRVAFVQANQCANPNQSLAFAEDFSFYIDVHCLFYPPAKQRYGFLMFYGHGGIIRTDVWREVGGFPEMVTEDLAFSSVARERGYIGMYAHEVVCYEDFPGNYRKYLRRSERWIKGTTEYLLKLYPKLLVSKRVPWYEKLDIAISAAILMNAIPFMAFLILTGFALPYATRRYGLNIPMVSTFSFSLNETLQSYRMGEPKYVEWSVVFYVIMLMASLAQLVPIIAYSYKRPGRMLRCVAEFVFISLSTIPTYTRFVFTFLLTGKTTFTATGAKADPRSSGRGASMLAAFDILTASALVAIFFRTSNPWLLASASAIYLNPVLYYVDWSTVGVNLMIYVPLMVALSTAFLIGLSFI